MLMRYWSVDTWPLNPYILDKSRLIGKKYIGFWGHTGKPGVLGNECFSQWYIREFIVDGITYCCMEQYMMAMKAICFDDYDIFRKIMNSANPKDIKALGRRVHNFNSVTWDRVKQDIIRTGNFEKFTQNLDLMNYLVNTGDSVLVEASPYDIVWGIGMRATDPNFYDFRKWRGENLLGFSLMHVRDEIKARFCM